MEKKEILDAFHFRHACKEFDPNKKITKEDFDFILETGHLSPSSFGLEPWKFIVVQNREIREKLREVSWGGKKQLPTASHVIVILYKKAHFMRFGSDYIMDYMRKVQKLPEEAISARSKFIEEFQRSDFELMDDRALHDWACRQTYLALANMMTAAAMIGIDSCPMEGFVAKKLEKVLEQELKVDLHKYGISCMVAFGYRVNPPRAKTRLAIEEVVEWAD